MLQSLTTLLFATLAIGAMSLISALVAEDWAAVRCALGLGFAIAPVPLPRHARVVALRQVPVLRLTPSALPRAA